MKEKKTLETKSHIKMMKFLKTKSYLVVLAY